MFDIELVLPFSLGIVTAINPCGFAMLPTWLGYFIGKDTADSQARPEQVLRGLVVSLTLTTTFVGVFGFLGFLISHLVNEETIARKTPWITVILGALLIPYGFSLLLKKNQKKFLLFDRRGPKSNEIFSVIGFGISYAIVSVGCSAPLFLLQISGSFSRQGIFEGTIIFLTYALGLGAVVTVSTLSLALARGGLVRNLRKTLPYVDLIGAISLLIGGAYLFIYGIYEIRTLNSPGVGANQIVEKINELQSHLTIWVSEVGGLEIGLALWLIVLTFIIWGLNPAFTGIAKKVLRLSFFGIWFFIEGVLYKGTLIIKPIVYLVLKWPERVTHWFEKPKRWAVPLEILFSSLLLLIVFLSCVALYREKKK
ncbi:MAG: cytochrome c biogenesis protein CcdA [Actinomycetota bacterium]|nr:cytochrome c biogenesis protein CcdA [Actinomycetota bacterium]|tara:strand:- start:13518 stop:14618 length:1101 start_codon:yes stop_codon:yes gene_type:complete